MGFVWAHNSFSVLRNPSHVSEHVIQPVATRFKPIARPRGKETKWSTTRIPCAHSHWKPTDHQSTHVGIERKLRSFQMARHGTCGSHGNIGTRHHRTSGSQGETVVLVGIQVVGKVAGSNLCHPTLPIIEAQLSHGVIEVKEKASVLQDVQLLLDKIFTVKPWRPRLHPQVKLHLRSGSSWIPESSLSSADSFSPARFLYLVSCLPCSSSLCSHPPHLAPPVPSLVLELYWRRIDLAHAFVASLGSPISSLNWSRSDAQMGTQPVYMHAHTHTQCAGGCWTVSGRPCSSPLPLSQRRRCRRHDPSPCTCRAFQNVAACCHVVWCSRAKLLPNCTWLRIGGRYETHGSEGDMKHMENKWRIQNRMQVGFISRNSQWHSARPRPQGPSFSRLRHSCGSLTAGQSLMGLRE